LRSAGLATVITIIARYPKRLAGAWRWIYAIGAVICLYFNLFVLVVQLFEKVPALHGMTPTQTEPPFQVTQLVVLALFVLLGIVAGIRASAIAIFLIPVTFYVIERLFAGRQPAAKEQEQPTPIESPARV
jgi:hypothetical protein